MAIIILAVMGSLAFLWITVAIALGRFGAGGVALFCLLAGFFSVGVLPLFLSLFSPVWIVQSLLTLFTALVCAGFRVKPKAMARTFVAVTVVSFGVAIAISFSAYRNYDLLREHFPIESMASRLAYESKASGEVPLSDEVEERLNQVETNNPWNGRRQMLQALHSQRSGDFVAARGFGIGRMMLPVEERIELPHTKPIPLPPMQEQSYMPDGTPVPVADGDRPHPQKHDLLSMHSSGLGDFLDPERMGYVKDRDHVAGFVPHRFTKMPESKTAFQLVRLELVSLLKHETPVAYVSQHLPQMDELRDAPTRPLDDFERGAIDRLRSDEDLVIDDAPNRIRMVGSLRAGKDCMECHPVRRGELLGAFSYELIGGQPIPVRAEPGA